MKREYGEKRESKRAEPNRVVQWRSSGILNSLSVPECTAAYAIFSAVARFELLLPTLSLFPYVHVSGRIL